MTAAPCASRGRPAPTARAPRPCAGVTTSVRLADDGTFAAQAVRTVNSHGGAYVAPRGTVDVSGTFDGPTATGTVRLSDVRTTKGARKRSCPEAAGTFTLRDPGMPSGPATAAPAPGTLLHGLTGRRTGGVRGGVLARVSKNGRTIDELHVDVGMICAGDRIFERFSPVKRLAADGSFDTPERPKTFFADAIERWTARTRGGFLPGGALAGRFDAVIRTRCTSGPRKGRRTICDPAARLRFWAVP